MWPQDFARAAPERFSGVTLQLVSRAVARGGALAFLAAALGAPGASAQGTLHLLEGEYFANGFGSALAGGADVTGDGTLDFLIGTSGCICGPGLDGRVAVHSGVDAGTIFEVYGNENASVYEGFGTSVGFIGDVDGDGIADFTVSAPGESPAPGVTGVVRVVSGKTGVFLATATIATEGAPWSSVGFGTIVAGMGDVDGDGVSDVLATLPRLDSASGVVDAGGLRILSGTDLSICSTFYGDAAHEKLGATAAVVGDVDLDGVNDAVLGNDDAGGRVVLVSGASGATLWIKSHDPALAPSASRAVGAVGDVDEDGVPDFAVGSAEYQTEVQGACSVYSGAMGYEIHEIHGVRANSIAGVGDVDADHVPDFLIGGLGVRAYSGRTGKRIWTALGLGAKGGPLGVRVASCGDLDGDGRGDWLAGNGLEFGYQYVVAGSGLGGDLRLGDLLVGKIGFEADHVDQVFFCGLAGAKVSMVSAVEGHLEGVRFHVRRANGKLVDSWTVSSGELEESEEFNLPEDGVYELRVAVEPEAEGTPYAYGVATTVHYPKSILHKQLVRKGKPGEGVAVKLRAIPGMMLSGVIAPMGGSLPPASVAVFPPNGAAPLDLTGAATVRADGAIVLEGLHLPYLGKYRVEVPALASGKLKLQFDLALTPYFGGVAVLGE